MAGYHVENFGCRASHADGEAIAAELAATGLEEAPALERAAVVILNTCAVTAEAERTARAFLRRVRRKNPGARVVITGCYAQRAPAEAAALPGVDAVVGNSHKGWTAAVASQFAAPAPRPGAATPPETAVPSAPALIPLSSVRSPSGVPIFADDRFAHADLSAVPLFASGSEAPYAGRASHSTRPNLKVQDGCGNRCSFCIIPVTRGASRSMPLAAVLELVRRFAGAGGSELVLSGINLGRWGRDLAPVLRFEDLVAAILHQTALPRLRLSSIEPMDWNPALLALYREFGAAWEFGTASAGGAGPRLARHAHLPLQSGADAILRAMHRRYRPWHYEEKLAAIRAAMPDAAIGADVMAGFPGESDALFEESYRFISRQPFTYLHLFPFSARPGTPGWQLHQSHPVPGPVVEDRLQRLRGLIAEKNRAFRASFLGRQLPLVTLQTSPAEQARGRTAALSDNFIKIELASVLPSNQMLRAHITSISSDGLVASTTARPQTTG